MSRIIHTRCRNHPGREAAARCTKCGGYFCRECIIEHHERMICAGCLRRPSDRRAGRRLLSALTASFRLAAGVLILWITFYNLGRLLLFLRSGPVLARLLGLPVAE